MADNSESDQRARQLWEDFLRSQGIPPSSDPNEYRAFVRQAARSRVTANHVPRKQEFYFTWDEVYVVSSDEEDMGPRTTTSTEARSTASVKSQIVSSIIAKLETVKEEKVDKKQEVEKSGSSTASTKSNQQKDASLLNPPSKIVSPKKKTTTAVDDTTAEGIIAGKSAAKPPELKPQTTGKQGKASSVTKSVSKSAILASKPPSKSLAAIPNTPPPSQGSHAKKSIASNVKKSEKLEHVTATEDGKIEPGAIKPPGNATAASKANSETLEQVTKPKNKVSEETALSSAGPVSAEDVKLGDEEGLKPSQPSPELPSAKASKASDPATKEATHSVANAQTSTEKQETGQVTPPSTPPQSPPQKTKVAEVSQENAPAKDEEAAISQDTDVVMADVAPAGEGEPVAEATPESVSDEHINKKQKLNSGHAVKTPQSTHSTVQPEDALQQQLEPVLPMKPPQPQVTPIAIDISCDWMLNQLDATPATELPGTLVTGGLRLDHDDRILQVIKQLCDSFVTAQLTSPSEDPMAIPHLQAGWDASEYDMDSYDGFVKLVREAEEQKTHVWMKSNWLEAYTHAALDYRRHSAPRPPGISGTQWEIDTVNKFLMDTGIARRIKTAVPEASYRFKRTRYYLLMHQLRMAGANIMIGFKGSSWLSLALKNHTVITYKALLAWNVFLEPLFMRLNARLRDEQSGDYRGLADIPWAGKADEADSDRWFNSGTRWATPQDVANWVYHHGATDQGVFTNAAILRHGYKGHPERNFEHAVALYKYEGGKIVCLPLVEIPKGAFLGILPGAVHYDSSKEPQIPKDAIAGDLPGLYLTEGEIIGKLTHISRGRELANTGPAWELRPDAAVPGAPSLRVNIFATRPIPAFQELSLQQKGFRRPDHVARSPPPDIGHPWQVQLLHAVLWRAVAAGHDIGELGARYWSLVASRKDIVRVANEDQPRMEKLLASVGMYGDPEQLPWVARFAAHYQLITESKLLENKGMKTTLSKLQHATLAAMAVQKTPRRLTKKNAKAMMMGKSVGKPLKPPSSKKSASSTGKTAKLPTSDVDDQVSGMRGLENLGNTCFMNASLQLLARCDQLVSVLEGSAGWLDHDPTASTRLRWRDPEMWALVNKFPFALNGVVAEMKKVALVKPVTPKSFVELARRLRPDFPTGTEGDAHEFLMFVAEALRDAVRHQTATYPEEPDDLTTFEGARAACWIDLINVHGEALIFKILWGIECNTMKCTSCDGETIKAEPFTILSLPLKEMAVGERTTIAELFNAAYGGSTAVCSDCDKCGLKLAEKIKKTALVELPPWLFVSLGRFADDGSKNSGAVDMPPKLDLREHLRQSDDSPKISGTYRLVGIVKHHGRSLHQGHYTAQIQDSTGQWWDISDAVVRRVEEKKVFEAGDAYQLLWQRS